jgi:hypothetical protein
MEEMEEVVRGAKAGKGGAAMDAAISGRTSSPLSELQRQAQTSGGGGKESKSLIPTMRSTVDRKLLPMITRDAPRREQHDRWLLRDDASGRDTLGGILSIYGRESSVMGLALGSPGDEAKHRLKDAPPIPIPDLPERSPRRRFFGRALKDGESRQSIMII